MSRAVSKTPKSRRPDKEPEILNTSAAFPPDEFEASNVTFLDDDVERELLGWLSPDEQRLWHQSKVTRRTVVPTLLRRLVAARRGM